MSGIIFAFFALSAILFFGVFHYLVAIKKPGIYPPKKVLRKRAGALASAGLIFLILGIILYTFNH